MMNGIGWRGLAGALTLGLAAVAGLYAGRMLAPHAVAEDAPPQAAPAPDVQPAPPSTTITASANPNFRMIFSALADQAVPV